MFFKIVYLLIVLAVVYFGYRKSNRFYRELREIPDDQKQYYLKQKGQLGFWEGGAVTRLPKCIAIIGNILALAALGVISAYLLFFAFCWYQGL